MFDTIIIGAGTAGFAAAIYAARSKMKTLVIGAEIGGTAAKAYEIENYPGFKKILGKDLAQRIRGQVENLGVEIKADIVKSIQKKGYHFEVNLTVSEEVLSAKTIILATGTKHRELGLKSEKKFSGKGISFCATCDGYFFKNKTVAIIGGGDAAATAAIFLGEICSKVYLIFRKKVMRAEPFWIDKIKQNPKVEMMPQKNVQEFCGKEKLEYLLLDTKEKIDVDGAFVQIGADAETKLADLLNLEKDNKGFIKVYKDQSTSYQGIFAAGDVTNGSNHFEQVATSVSEGAIAANAVFMYLQENSKY